jgi:spore maturation protein SpmA
MLNWIWMAMITIGIVVAALLDQLSGENGIVTGMFNLAKIGVVNIAIPLAAVMMIWLGIMRLAEKSGMVSALARLLRPVMTKLFPDVPDDHPAMGAIIMNMSANMLGLGNAATPLGLKAMQELDRLNPEKGTATNAMCTFLAINTSSVTIIPATAVGLLAAQGIADPYAIVSTALGATICSTIVAITAVKFFEKLPMFRMKTVAAADRKADEESVVSDTDEEKSGTEVETPLRPIRPWMIVASLAAVLLFVGIGILEAVPDVRVSLQESLGLRGVALSLDAEKATLDEVEPSEKSTMAKIFGAVSVTSIPFVLFFFILFAAIRGVRVYEEFVEGAKEGWSVAVRIMPFLVAMLVALAIFRNSGCLYLLQEILRPVLNLVGFPVDLVPMALMRPLSGSGSQAVLVEILANDGISDTVKYAAATMFGSTETTFYVLAVYFGSVAVRRTRHALLAGLCADAAGVIAAVAICRMVFG